LLSRVFCLPFNPELLVFATPASDAFPPVLHEAIAASPMVPEAAPALSGLQGFLQKIVAQVGAHFHLIPALTYLLAPAIAAFTTGNWGGVIAALLAHGSEIFPGVDPSLLEAAVANTPAPALA
jgi:hypothetical protein